MKRTLSRGVVIGLLVAALMMPSPPPAQASEGATATAIATWTGAAVGGALAAYIAWRNRPNSPNPIDWSSRGPGGFYIGAFTGGSFVPSSNWRYTSDAQAPLPYNVTAQSVRWSGSMLGGLKAGYFFHKFPYLGLDGEFNYTRNSIPEQHVRLSPPLPADNRIPGAWARLPRQSVSIMTLALHIVGRYGFFKDEEVPFGRFQPYVGIGPGFSVIYGEVDAAKNFGIDALAGLRFMMSKNLSAFVEYKFNRQFDVELEHQKLKQLPNFGGFEQRGKATFDFTMHQFLVGICFHFL
jgi:opacity protein-like surface antigen